MISRQKDKRRKNTKKTKRQKRTIKTKKTKKTTKESLVLWRQGSFALLRCLFLIWGCFIGSKLSHIWLKISRGCPPPFFFLKWPNQTFFLWTLPHQKCWAWSVFLNFLITLLHVLWVIMSFAHFSTILKEIPDQNLSWLVFLESCRLLLLTFPAGDSYFISSIYLLLPISGLSQFFVCLNVTFCMQNCPFLLFLHSFYFLEDGYLKMKMVSNKKNFPLDFPVSSFIFGRRCLSPTVPPHQSFALQLSTSIKSESKWAKNTLITLSFAFWALTINTI